MNSLSRCSHQLSLYDATGYHLFPAPSSPLFLPFFVRASLRLSCSSVLDRGTVGLQVVFYLNLIPGWFDAVSSQGG